MKLSSKKMIAGAIFALAGALVSSGVSATDYRGSKVEYRNSKVVGRWGFTTDQTCSRSLGQAPGSVSIEPDTRIFNTDIDIVDMSGSGEMVFKHDGTFILTNAKAAEMDKSNLLAGAMPVTDGFVPECIGEYKMTGRNQFYVEFQCEIDVAAQGLKIDAGPVLADGYVNITRTGISMNLLQNVQTLTVSKDGMPIGERQRVCLQRFALQKIGRR